MAQRHIIKSSVREILIDTLIYLIKAHQFDFSTHIDARRTDTEDTGLLQPRLSIHCTNRHGCWEGGGHYNGNDVQGADDDFTDRFLKQEEIGWFKQQPTGLPFMKEDPKVL